MLNIDKCAYEESFYEDDQTVHYFIYPKELGMEETEFYSEEDYDGNIISMCLSLTIPNDGEPYLQMSPTIEEKYGLCDVDWRDLFLDWNYTESIISKLVEKTN